MQAINVFAAQMGHAVPPQSIGSTPGLRDAELRAKLIEEEAEETADALRAGDLVKAVDGLGDLLVVTLGAGVALGVDLQAVFREVMASNWTKFRPGAAIRPDGKLVKSPDFVEPNIARELRAQGWDNKS